VSARLPNIVRRWPRLWKAALVAALVAVGLLGFTNAYVVLTTRGEATGSVDQVRHANAALVLGAFVRPNGRMSTMLSDRVHQAAGLWRAGKVDRVLVSGDHHTWSYDEPDTMRKALVREGVPARAIFEDHAGFNTWASVLRAHKVFGLRSAVIVTQGFHMPRALFLARAAHLKAVGLTSDLHHYGVQGTASDLRELLSRGKAVFDAGLSTGVVLGSPVPISGDGRASWGPAPPPGTPPAGSPGR
jgi:SanA protein